MKLSTVSVACGAAALAATTLLLAPAHAETVRTINGVAIDSTVLDLYIETRSQKPLAQVTPEERASMLDELTDIYLITTQDRAKELADDARVKAQAELQFRGLMAQVVASDFITSNPATDDEIFAAYSAQLEAQPAKQFKARHILLTTQDDAMEAISALDDGADFVELAKERSTGPSGPSGGDLGWFSPEQMVKPFSDAVVALEDGAYSQEPVQTQFGWHVILREDTRDNEPPPLESVRDSIKQQVEQQKLQTYIENLRSSE